VVTRLGVLQWLNVYCGPKEQAVEGNQHTYTANESSVRISVRICSYAKSVPEFLRRAKFCRNVCTVRLT